MKFERKLTEVSRMAALYHAAFPKYPPLQVVTAADGGGRIEGLWTIGHSFRNKFPYYGGFPGNLLKRMMSMFPGKASRNMLHLFSGGLPGGDYLRYDARQFETKEYVDNALVRGDAENLYDTLQASPWWKDVLFDLVIADPPYTQADAVKYGFEKLVNYKKVLAEVHKVLRPGGWLLWLATRIGIYSNMNWRLGLIVPVYCGTNKIIRCLWGLQKR